MSIVVHAAWVLGTSVSDLLFLRRSVGAARLQTENLRSKDQVLVFGALSPVAVFCPRGPARGFAPGGSLLVITHTEKFSDWPLLAMNSENFHSKKMGDISGFGPP